MSSNELRERLKPLLAGRAGHEPLPMRWVHEQVKGKRDER
jgi:hypothetical protein